MRPEALKLLVNIRDALLVIRTSPDAWICRLIHGYDNVDDAIVWDVVTRKLPDLENEVLILMQ